MIVYRLYRDSLEDAMKEVKTFGSSVTVLVL